MQLATSQQSALLQTQLQAAESHAAAKAKANVPDLTKRVPLKMVRSAVLILNQQDAGKTLAVGKYMANGGGIDGVVTNLDWYPGCCVIATVRKGAKVNDAAAGSDKYVLIQGDLDCEVL